MRYLLLLPVFAAVLTSICFGSVSLNIFSPENFDIVFGLRLPRAVFSFFVGAMLGLSGAIYQLVLRNPLADSFTTGAASSSALGAVIAIAMGFNALYVPPVAFLTGMLGLVIVYRLSGGANSAVTMILCGVIVNIVASSFMGFIKFYFEDSLSSIVFWLMGGFSYVDMKKLIIVIFVFGISYAFINSRAGKLDMLAFDENTASTSGVSVKKERAAAFFTATLLVACAVSYSGLIGFVGLIVPHISRSLFGTGMRSGIYYSSLFGGLLLLTADTIARSAVSSGAEIPVGIITSVIGGFFFFYILRNRRQEIWHD